MPVSRRVSVVIAGAFAAGSLMTVSPSTAAPEPAAAKYYSSCDNLHRDFKYGVARSRKAANKQVRDGYHRPAFGSKARGIYKANYSRLDRDRDGTACEA